MNGVVINLSKFGEGPDTPPAAAEIFNTRLQSIQQFELCANTPKEVPLDPGSYLVRAHLPSGEIIDAPATVGEGLQQVELAASESLHEWLSWQHFLGDLGTQTDQELPIPPKVRASTWLRVWTFENGS